MKIVAILGSPHGPRGATGTLMAEVIRGAQAAGADVTALSLTDHRVRPCQACDACHKTGVCPQKDEFNAIKAAMLAADGIILASPNYIVSVTAQMKAVFDRFCGPLHCQAMQGKYAVAVETSGGIGGEDVQKYMLAFLRVLGCATAGSVGATTMDLADKDRRAAVYKQAGELGAALVRAINQKASFPDQQAEQKEFFERMKAVVQYHQAEWPYEYEYWKGKVWL